MTFGLLNNGNIRFNTNNTISSNVSISINSDDRLKDSETFIINASETLMKLRPQIYKKYKDFNRDISYDFIIESGLIAQEVFYDASELRHLISLPHDSSLNILINNISSSNEPMFDPDYTKLGWGTTPSGLNYQGLIPYLIKGFQEQQNIINSLTLQIEEQKNDIQILRSLILKT